MTTDFDELEMLLKNIKTETTTFFSDGNKNVGDYENHNINESSSRKNKYIQQGQESNIMTFTDFILGNDVE